MTSPTPGHGRLAHGDLPTVAELGADGDRTRRHLARAARAAGRPAPSLAYDDQPTDQPKRQVTVSAAASRLAAAIYGD